MSSRTALRWTAALLALVVVVLAGGMLYLRHLLSADSIARILNAAIAPATNQLYVVDVAATDYSLRKGDLTLRGVAVRTDMARLNELAANANHPALRFEVNVGALSLDGLHLARLALRRDIVATGIVVSDAEVIVTIDPDPLVAAVASGGASGDGDADASGAAPLSPAERLRAALVGIPTLAFERIALEGGALRVDTLTHDPLMAVEDEAITSSDVIGRIDVAFYGVLLDETAPVEHARNLFSDDIRLRISNVETRQLGGNVLRLGTLTASTKEEKIDLAGFSYRPTRTPGEYLDQPQIAESDRVEVLVDSLGVEGLAFARYMDDLEVFVRQVTVDGFRLDILSDKHKPRRAAAARAPMPHDFFRGLKRPFTIEAVTLRNGQVSYSERPGDGVEPGTITFTDVTARLTNLSNDPTRMTVETPAILEASTRANSVAQANVQWRIPLLSPRPTMTSRGQISTFDPTTLNPTLVPLLGVRAKSGTIESVTYEFRYSPDGIEGELDAAYRDLAVELLDKNTGKSSLGNKIIGFVANTVAIRSNNPARPGAVPQRGLLDQPLDPADPFFKLIWIAIRDAMAAIVARIG
jgi:hypothetical protein